MYVNHSNIFQLLHLVNHHGDDDDVIMVVLMF